jgi:hypothetical protein
MKQLGCAYKVLINPRPHFMPVTAYFFLEVHLYESPGIAADSREDPGYTVLLQGGYPFVTNQRKIRFGTLPPRVDFGPTKGQNLSGQYLRVPPTFLVQDKIGPPEYILTNDSR